MSITADELKLLHQTVRDFARVEVRPHARAWDRDTRFPTEIMPRLAELGLFGLAVPTAYGGSGLPMTGVATAIEAVAWGDGGLAVALAAHNSLCANHIVQFASEEQKQRYLPDLANGERFGSWCLTEPTSGSDAAAMKTRAERRGDDWVLNGSKAFITNASLAGVFVVMAVTDPAAGRGGITAFLVERGTAGLEVGKKEDKLGVRSSDTAGVHLTDCVIADTQRVGALGDGYRQAMRVLDRGRIGIAAMATGLGRAALDASVEYAQQREAYGKPIASLQAIQFQLADMATEMDAAWLLTEHAAECADRGEPFQMQASMAKMYASEAAARATDRAVKIHGGYGFIKDYPVERFYRDIKLCEIGEGTNEVQRAIISKVILDGSAAGDGAGHRR
jgi:alkylation response protein AidB-like acyl-CoA dehydrogenase